MNGRDLTQIGITMKSILYYIKMDDLNNFEKYKVFINYLGLEKQKHINNFRFDIDKKLSLFSDLFVRYLICRILNISNKKLIFTKNAYGKPYLLNFSGIQFNISHTRNAIVVGISNKEIGVDIEKIKVADLKIAERFFSRGELNYILSVNTQRELLFYEIWTRKEAYIKWMGKGLSLPLSEFDVTSPKINSRTKVFNINEYIISLCCDECPDHFEFVELNEYQVFKIISVFLGL